MGFGNKALNYGIGKLSDFKDVYDNKLSYGDYIQKRQADGEAIADRINKGNTPAKFFGDRFFDYGNQSLASKTMNSKDADTKEQVDAKDSSFLSGVITALNTGTFDVYIDKLNDIKQMTPEEIEDANVLNLQPGEGAKALERIDKIIAKAEKVQKRFNYETSKRKNPINPNDYAPGTKEREDAELYYKAWEAAKFNVIFLNSSLDENLERLNELGGSFKKISEQSSATNPIFQTDVTSIYDRGTLASEIDILTNEINALTGVEDPKLQAEKTAKEKKLARLQGYKEAQDKYVFFKQQVEQIRKFGKDVEAPTEEEASLIASKDDELAEILKGFSYRGLKEECLDLPDKIYVKRNVVLTEEQSKLYKQMKTMALAILNGKQTTTVTVLTQLMRLHQITCGHFTADDGSTQSVDDVNQNSADESGVLVSRRRSGGGAVFVHPSDSVWIDITISRDDPLWKDDVAQSMLWLGEFFVEVQQEFGQFFPTPCHRRERGRCSAARSRCFQRSPLARREPRRPASS